RTISKYIDPAVQTEQGFWNGKYSCSVLPFKFRDLIGRSFVQAQFHFLDGGFESATLTFKTQSYGEISQAFIAKYGKPDSVKDSVVQNKMGATFADQTMTWAGKQGATIVLRKLAGKVTDGAARISTKKWNEDRAREAKEVGDRVKQGGGL